MAKLVKRAFLGKQPVYDIGVNQDHNFLLGNGLVASNCFNKSHSTAYGLVTFQTAYLKANFPTEYMAALLSSVGADHDKLQRYIAYCLLNTIEVQPPDINRSGMDFTPLKSGQIVFGLGAVKNIGDAAIENILEVRDDGGMFQSLADFCDRVDLHKVNRRGIEALIYAGAFDKINSNRGQLMADLEPILAWSADRAKAKAIGQTNLFDLMSGGSTATAPPKQTYAHAPYGDPTEDFSPQEKLKMEKELLGFYVSDHPLKNIQSQARLLAPVKIGRISECSPEVPVNLIVIINAIKNVTTKKSDRMAILSLEDMTGTCEGVVFPKTYERIKDQLEVDQRLMVWAKVDFRDDQTQLIINEAEPIDGVRLVQVQLPAEEAGDIQFCHSFSEVLKRERGEQEEGRIPVIARVSLAERYRFVRLGPQFRVKSAESTVAALQAAGFKAEVIPLVSA